MFAEADTTKNKQMRVYKLLGWFTKSKIRYSKDVKTMGDSHSFHTFFFWMLAI
jgi:hypothetical protein